MKDLFTKELGGWDSQKKLSPLHRVKIELEEIESKNPKTAAVMCLIYKEDDVWKIPLIKRPDYQGFHSNQISLPGGKREKTDKNILETAKRETFEEIGAKIEYNQSMIRELTYLYIPTSNFLVYPFLAYSLQEFTFVREEKEVAEILHVPVSELLQAPIHFMKIDEIQQGEVPYFLLQNHKVWGATAMILSEVKDILKTISL